MTVFQEKSARAAASARLLCEAGDYDGAVNRAYYAMLDAARDLLNARGFDVTSIRTHRGLAMLFRRQLQSEQVMAAHVAQFVQSAAETRAAADYDPITTNCETAEQVLKEMDQVLAIVQTSLSLK